MADNTLQTDADALGVPRNLQIRNVIVYVVLVGLTYLSAPVTYVDAIHSALINAFGGSNALANLPTTANLWMTAIPILVTWLFPHRRIAKRAVMTCYLIQALMGGLVALCLILPTANIIRIVLLVIHGGALGACSSVGGVYGWEIISRGMSDKLRGRAFSFAFGLGPLFAVMGSRTFQWVVDQKDSLIVQMNGVLYTLPTGYEAMLGLKPGRFPFPNDYILIFIASLPLLGTMAMLSLLYYVHPEGKTEKAVVREPFVSYVFGGFGEFVRQKTLLLVLLGYLIAFICWFVFNNASLNIPNIMPGMEPKDAAGNVQALRFGGKMVAGFILGFLVTRLGPRAGIIGTAAFTALAVAWLLPTHGSMYFAAFALFGAGELAGVYYPNYCMMASKPEHVKRNMSFFFLNGLVPIPLIHGWVADHWGFHATFVVALAAGILAVFLAFLLPYIRPVAKNKASLATPQ